MKTEREISRAVVALREQYGAIKADAAAGYPIDDVRGHDPILCMAGFGDWILERDTTGAACFAMMLEGHRANVRRHVARN